MTALTLGLVLVAQGSINAAGADTKRFKDAKNDAPRALDIRKVVVKHRAKRVKVNVRWDDFQVSYRSALTYWFDTKRKRKGPEYVLFMYPDSEMGLFKAKKSWKSGAHVRCAHRASFSAYGPHRARLAVPRSCLGKPTKVRVSVRSTEHVGSRTYRDFAPAKKRFYGWVKR